MRTRCAQTARRTLAAFRAAAAAHGTQARVYYAGKAFLSTEMVRWVTEEGLAVDVCTGGELAVALAAGADPARLGFHGNNKSVAELERAVKVGIGSIVIDSWIELERLAAIVERRDAVQAVLVRVNSGVHAETHDFLATAHEDQKFGFTLTDAAAAVARIREIDGLSFIGLHCHIGSQIFGTAGFRESAARVVELHAELLAGGDIPVLNLGGGFGIAYTATDDPTPIEELAAGIADAVAQECEVRGIPIPNLAFEPGRAIVGRAGVTLYEVGTTKPVQVDDELHAPLRERRRRHERQRAARAVRRAVLRPARLPHERREAGPGARGRPALRVGRHRRGLRVPARRRRTRRPRGGAGDRRVLLRAGQQLQLRSARARRGGARRQGPHHRARRDDRGSARPRRRCRHRLLGKARHDRLSPPASSPPRRRSRRLPGRRAPAAPR